MEPENVDWQLGQYCCMGQSESERAQVSPSEV